MTEDKYYPISEKDIERIKKFTEEMKKLQLINKPEQKIQDYTGLIPETFLG